MFSPTPRDRVLVLTSLLSRCMRDVARIRSESTPVSGLSSTGATHPPSTDLSAVVTQREAEVRDMLLHRYFVSMSTPRHVLSVLTLLDTPAGGTGKPSGLDVDFEGLLNACLSYLLQHAETAVLDVVSPQSMVGSSGKAPDHVVAVKDFMLRVLALVFNRAVSHESKQGNACHAFCVSFSRRVVRECGDLLEFCGRVGAWPVDPAAATPALLEQKARALRALQGVVGALLTLVATTLSALGVRLCDVAGLLPHLLRLVGAVDSLTVGLPEVVHAEHELATGAVKWKRTSRSVVLETPHPVGSNSWSQWVQVPGATKLEVTFEAATKQTLNSVGTAYPFMFQQF